MATPGQARAAHALLAMVQCAANAQDADQLQVQGAQVTHPIDAWIEAIPDNPYDLCPCGCGMKWRFAVKDGIEKHEARFLETHKEDEQ